MNESRCLNGSSEICSEWQQDTDIFSSDASCEGSGVYLIVTCFHMISVFCEEGEFDLGPSGVFPFCSNYERNSSEIVSQIWFD